MRTVRMACLMATVAVCLTLAPAALARQAAPVRWATPVLADHRPPLADPTALSSVSCPASTTCLAVGENGTVVTVRGGTRTIAAGVDGGADLSDIACPSTSLCVVAEPARLLVSTDPTAAHPRWRRSTIPPAHDQFAGVTCASTKLCLAWPDADAVEVSTDPGGGASTWRTVSLAAPSQTIEVQSVACAPGTTQCVASLGGAGEAVFATTVDPGGGASAWTSTAQPGIDSPEDIACPSASLCVGEVNGNIETSVDPLAGAASWSSGAVVSSIHAGFTGIACPSASVCMGAISDGSVAITSDAAAGASSYAVSPVLDPAGLGTGAVTPPACPTTATCLVPDRSPGLATVSLGPPPSASVAAGLGGTTAITGLSCPAADLCVGTDDGGGILRTSRPAGSASGWRRTVQPAAATGTTRDLLAVDCPSTRFCLAGGAGDVLETTTHPATATRWTATKLSFTTVGGDGETYVDALGGISCPSAKLCVVGNSGYGIIVSAHPSGGASAWRLDPVGAFDADHFQAVSCPTTTLCVAGDDSFGRIAVSTSPGAAHGHWKLRRIAAGVGSLAPGIVSVSCPSATFCLAGDTRGAVHWTTRPTGTASAWHTVSLGTGRLTAVSCRSRTLCVAIDAHDRAYVTTDATGGRSAWHVVRLATGHFPIGSAAAESLRALACAPRHLCLAASGAGVVFPGRTVR